MKKDFHHKTPKPKKDREEFGPGKTDIIICKECGAAYYYKSWHHRLEDYPELSQSKPIKFTLCPACRMIESGKYEGEVMVENFPEEIEKELKNLIENFGERARERDPLDRIISIKESKTKRGKNLRILTTENQLAQRLGKKINEVFGKKHKVVISHSDSEDVIRVRVVF